MRIKSNQDQLAKIFQQKLDRIKESDQFHLVENFIPDAEKENLIKKEIEKEIVKSFHTISEILDQKKDEKPNAFLFEFAGADISPYIPTTCWINGHSLIEYSDKTLKSEKLIFETTGGFDLELLEPLYEVLEENDELLDLDIYDDMKLMLIYKTFSIIAEVIKQVLSDYNFSDLVINQPFYFLITRGHDEDIELLLSVQKT